MYIGLHVKCRLLLSDCNETGIFSTDLPKNTQISNLIKILPVEAEFIHADGRKVRQADMRKANSRFCEFRERGQKTLLSEITPTP